jgi:DNA-binding transcriptional LysR family regulator
MPKKSAPTKSPARRYFKEVRFRQIRALVELSRQGSFASAAASLGRAVPSVWQQIRALEDEYGVQLVVAQGAQVSLTEDGLMLVDLAAPLVESFDSLREIFADRHRTTARMLTVVAPAPMLSGALRKPIIQYRKAHPTVKLTLIDRPSHAARQVIENDEADIAVIGIAKGDDPLPQFQSWPLARYPFHLICQKTHPLATARRITLADLVKQPLVLSAEDSSSHRQIRHIFEQANLAERMNVTMTATNRALLLSYVAIGFGIAIGTSAQAAKLPKPAAGEAELTMRDITNLFGHEEVVLLQRKGRHELPHVKAFREMVVKGMSET